LITLPHEIHILEVFSFSPGFDGLVTALAALAATVFVLLFTSNNIKLNNIIYILIIK